MVKVGTVICPEVYHGEGESWLNRCGISSQGNRWGGELYEDIKNTVVDLVASTSHSAAIPASRTEDGS